MVFLGFGFYSVLEWVSLTPRRLNFDKNLRKQARHFERKTVNFDRNRENPTNPPNHCYENLDSLQRRRAWPCRHGIWSVCDGSGGGCEFEYCAKSEWDDAHFDGIVGAVVGRGEFDDWQRNWKNQFSDVDNNHL